VLRLAAEGYEAPEGHELLAPTLLRSQTLSALQADALVTLDAEPARAAAALPETAPFEALSA